MKTFTSLLSALFVLLSVLVSHAEQVLAGRGVEIRIQGVPVEEQGRINGTYGVSQEGKVRMPDVGEVQIGGLKAHAAAAKLEAAYKSAGIYTSPTFQVFATIDGNAPRKETVTIAGFVRNPGPVDFTPGLTIFQAIAAAGGENEFGAMNRVNLMRGKSVKTYNMKVLEDRNVTLEPGDTIEVPKMNLLSR
jgi:protein involved in polysaccharide export with SLBB domain